MARKTNGFLACCALLLAAAPALAATGTVTSMAPASTAYGPAGGAGTVEVAATTPWSASTQANWITISSGSGQADGVVSFTVAPNATGTPRTGTITVGDHLFTVRQTAMDFADNMDVTAWPYPYLNALSAAGITNGCGNNNFCPNDLVTREQMAAFVVKALKGDNFTYTTTPYFMDVPPSDWSFKYVQKAKDLGITASTGTFNPTTPTTREQMAAMVTRALYGGSFGNSSTPYFSDVPPDQWSFNYVQKMKDQGLTTNTGTFDPAGMVTRAQMAAVVSRGFLAMQPSSTNVSSGNTAFTAGMLAGKTFQFDVNNMGTMTYTFNNNGTFTANQTNNMMNNNYSGTWMINDDGTLTMNTMTGMPMGYSETFTMMGGGGVMPPVMTYMNNSGTTQSNITMMTM